MSDDFADKRNQFNQDILKLVNVINKIFTPSDDKENVLQLKVSSKFSDLDNSTYNYKSLMNNDNKNDLLDKVCKNIAFIYAYPILKNTPFDGRKGEFPLKGLNLKNFPTTYGSVGIKNGNLNEYNFIDGAVVEEKFNNVQDTVCANDQVQKIKEYFYKKLKLLVYLSEIINLNFEEAKTDSAKNKYEKIYLNNTNPLKFQKKQAAKSKFTEWYQYLQAIFTEVMNDNYENKELEKYIKCFEETDEKTQTLCLNVYPLCENVDEKNAQNVCVKINLHSVTEDICDANVEQGQLQPSEQGQGEQGVQPQKVTLTSGSTGSVEEFLLKPPQKAATNVPGDAKAQGFAITQFTPPKMGALVTGPEQPKQVASQGILQEAQQAQFKPPVDLSGPQRDISGALYRLQQAAASAAMKPQPVSTTTDTESSSLSTQTSPGKSTSTSTQMTPSKMVQAINDKINNNTQTTPEQKRIETARLLETAEAITSTDSNISTPAKQKIENEYTKLRIPVSQDVGLITKCLGSEKLTKEINEILPLKTLSTEDRITLSQLRDLHEKYKTNTKSKFSL